ncbi:MAG TPA: hypothetical protein VFN11_21255, partial [Ktedonobacterales bacterium]|nr:hypothetical protein [Ktedonobacterales bacterium]
MRFGAGARAVIFDADGRVLLSHRRDCDFWNLPGGAVCLYQMRLLGSVVVTAACFVVAAVALDSLHVGLLVVLGVIAAGAVLALLYERYQQLVLALLFMLLALHGIPGFYGTTAQQDFRTPELWLQQQYQPGDGIFC